MSIEVITKRDVIRGVKERWEEQYRDYAPDFKFITASPNVRTKTVGEVREALEKLDLETCSSEDVDKAMGGIGGWANNCCSECGKDSQFLIHIGEQPDYEAQWVELCVLCMEKALKTLKDDIVKSLFPGRKA